MGRSGAGPPLGVISTAVYKPVAVTLEPGDLVVLYTDGVTESMDRDRQPFGVVEGLKKVLAAARAAPPRPVKPSSLPFASTLMADRSPTTSRSFASSAARPDADNRFRNQRMKVIGNSSQRVDVRVYPEGTHRVRGGPVALPVAPFQDDLSRSTERDAAKVRATAPTGPERPRRQFLGRNRS